ncbi:integral inner nuclear membrane protein Ima1 [Hirsutella rhossiliensis]|uniref:Integral inner nuclear membrane protein Ima1 n=1 Tax=Hirsutella rhossiliensis TaxID=111463 RepID=A0A9P8N5H3_9HYPO|nr:integral inner nuclear membrane protein Ima1 [Hirsutella rhossiliensis]KAH0966311.1 integral inner nuclear membrane protein Ima1 [Hirsutella rhossiliensis]
MARFRAARHLACFYCGKRSGLQYDGAIRDFLCLYCDATNYLDENGDIMDPPVATEREATMTRYAAPKSPTPTDSIFCPTCLKNQHLFTKSLAQYFPDDPSDPDYAQLERNYYRYRRGLEKRYPQVCDECADKVEARIRQAGYTAKTDHLRRMMDLSRGRKPTTTKTALDKVHSLGKAIWRAGFALQLLWHLTTMALVMQQPGDGLRDPDGLTASAIALDWAKRAATVLPAPDTLIWWSTGAAMASAWWNPHFVQLNRGFTRHLLGFTQWYCFQGLIIFCRLVFRGVLVIDGGQGQSSHAQLSAHIAMAAVTALIYVLSRRSIRVDTSPLFGTNSQPVAAREAASPATRKNEATKTLSELFNDALDSPNSTPQRPKPEQQTKPSPSPFRAAASRHHINSPAPLMKNLSMAPNSPTREVQYAEEMDWSPITPRHRAFADQPSPIKGTGMLGQAPAENMSSNPFRYKVPAAPLNPARRLRNPPRVPEPQQPPVEPNRVMFSGHRRESARDAERSEMRDGVEFRQPQFFAPERDDASSLADLLSQSFSLSQEDDQEDEDDGAGEGDGTLQGTRPSQTRTKASAKGNRDRARTWNPRLVEPLVLAALLMAWLSTLAIAIPSQVECQLAVMAMSGVLALRGTGDASAEKQYGPVAAHVLAAWAVAELATVCWVALTLWKRETAGVGWYGSGVLASMLAHQAWRNAT